MNVKTVVAIAVICGLASLSGCASMSRKGDSSAMAPAPAAPNANAISLTSGLTDDVDIAYVERINQEASAKGYLVLWLNPPQKKLDQAARRD